MFPRSQFGRQFSRNDRRSRSLPHKAGVVGTRRIDGRLVLGVCAVFAFAALGAAGAHMTSAHAFQSHAQGARLITTLHTALRPEPVIADPAHHRIYVGNESAAKITVLDDRTNAVIAVIPAGHEIEDLALERSTGRVYTANRNSNDVSVIGGSSLRVVATVKLGQAPNGIAVDGLRH